MVVVWVSAFFSDSHFHQYTLIASKAGGVAYGAPLEVQAVDFPSNIRRLGLRSKYKSRVGKSGSQYCSNNHCHIQRCSTGPWIPGLQLGQTQNSLLDRGCAKQLAAFPASWPRTTWCQGQKTFFPRHGWKAK